MDLDGGEDDDEHGEEVAEIKGRFKWTTEEDGRLFALVKQVCCLTGTGTAVALTGTGCHFSRSQPLSAVSLTHPAIPRAPPRTAQPPSSA